MITDGYTGADGWCRDIVYSRSFGRGDLDLLLLDLVEGDMGIKGTRGQGQQHSDEYYASAQFLEDRESYMPMWCTWRPT